MNEGAGELVVFDQPMRFEHAAEEEAVQQLLAGEGQVGQRAGLVAESEAVLNRWLLLVTTHRVIGKKSHDARLAALCQVESMTCLTFNTADFRRFDVVAVSPHEVVNP